jgi:hypothetical protein
MPRQAGKDELLTALEISLMRMLCDKDRNIVVVNPTYKPQTIGAILRLENRMDANLLTRGRWTKRSDHYRMIGSFRTVFLSGDGQANVVGAIANLLLVINEAQDILPATYEKKFSPMAASRNATRVFCGTVWTSSTLLAQMARVCREAEKADGIKRVFGIPPRMCAKRTRGSANSWIQRYAGWGATTHLSKRNSSVKRSMRRRACSHPGGRH